MSFFSHTISCMFKPQKYGIDNLHKHTLLWDEKDNLENKINILLEFDIL